MYTEYVFLAFPSECVFGYPHSMLGSSDSSMQSKRQVYAVDLLEAMQVSIMLKVRSCNACALVNGSA